MSRIIVADDDTQLLAALTVRLEAENYEVFGAQDAYQALQLVRSHEPDVIVLDINMPAGDGFSVQERLQNIEGLENTPVIYITGEDSPRVDRNAAGIGAFAVIHKPFETSELLSTIRQALFLNAKAA